MHVYFARHFFCGRTETQLLLEAGFSKQRQACVKLVRAGGECLGGYFTPYRANVSGFLMPPPRRRRQNSRRVHDQYVPMLHTAVPVERCGRNHGNESWSRVSCVGRKLRLSFRRASQIHTVVVAPHTTKMDGTAVLRGIQPFRNRLVNGVTPPSRLLCDCSPETKNVNNQQQVQHAVWPGEPPASGRPLPEAISVRLRGYLDRRRLLSGATTRR